MFASIISRFMNEHMLEVVNVSSSGEAVAVRLARPAYQIMMLSSGCLRQLQTELGEASPRPLVRQDSVLIAFAPLIVDNRLITRLVNGDSAPVKRQIANIRPPANINGSKHSLSWMNVNAKPFVPDV
jgi:hypothetical protein